jgi:hypothetical protein
MPISTYRPRRGTRGRSYRSLAQFYADPRRRASRERDFGLWWRDRSGRCACRAAWVESTGELYIAHLAWGGRPGGRVEQLGSAATPAELERLLPGWRERCGEPGSLEWLRERCAALGAGSAPAREQRAPKLRTSPRPGLRPALG